jgi:Ca2+-transporting ATPase
MSNAIMTIAKNKPAADRLGGTDAWHQLTWQQAVVRLGSDDEHGLTSSEASRRLRQHGPNQLAASDQRTWPTILMAQVNSSLVILLLAAALVSVLLGEFGDSIAIMAIILLNTLLGFWQDYRAEKSLAALKKLTVPDVTVYRDGTQLNISATDVVPGDVLLLQAGYLVPADCRLLEVKDLAIDESTLTGESLSVEKSTDKIERAELPLGDQFNVAFSGTMVVRGRGRAVVTATGMNTQLGKIAGSLQAVKFEPTPLQIKLGRLGRTLAVIAVVIVAFVFVVGLIAGQPPQLMLMTSLSLAVAIVPEGLPAVATVALAIGARRMFKQNALIRQLPAVETLGSVSVICSDKTGTLTQNRMTATVLDVANARLLLDESRPQTESLDKRFQMLLLGSCLCNDAQLQENERKVPVAVGEPTETALVEVAAHMGFDQLELQSLIPRTNELPFESERQRMSTIHSVSDQADAKNLVPDSAWGDKSPPGPRKQIAFVKGSVDSLLAISSFVWVDQKPVPLDPAWRQRIATSQDELAARGTRVLAIGFRPLAGELQLDELEREITFVGLIGLTDPPRPEAKTAVARCRQAGIRPIMITGDHPLTALSIARQLGISDTEEALIGQDLSRLPATELRDRVRHVGVFARVAPTDKLNIVEALQQNNEVVAMTGDGVNDAPALKQANVGVAMGQTGTDVSKQAAKVVLLDDNFATIVAAVEQGRIVYDNVRKFVKYTMSSNIGEILVMTIGVLLGMPLPLLPLQILWVNLVTDGLPGLALAVEPAEKNTMRRPPLSLDEPIFNRRMVLDLLWIGSLIGVISLVIGSLLWTRGDEVAHWRTIVFTVLTLAQMANAFACRSESRIWLFHRLLPGRDRGPNPSEVELKSRPKSNPWMWCAVGSTFVLQILVVYWPPLQRIFHTQALTMFEFSVCLMASLFVFAMIELQKLVMATLQGRPVSAVDDASL